MPPWEDVTPYADRTTRSQKLTATNVLLFLNIAAFAVTAFVWNFLHKDLSFLGFSAYAAIEGLRLWQFLTYPFVHPAEGWLICGFLLAGYGLYTVGNALEAEIGGRRLLLWYVTFSLYGAAAHAVYEFAAGPPSADGPRASMSLFAPVYGLAVVSAFRSPSRPVLFFFLLPMRMVTCTVLSGVCCVLYVAIFMDKGLSPVAVVGAAAAAAAVAAFEPRLDALLDRRSARRERDRFVEEVEVRREVDRILEKISLSGMASLTRGERGLLKRASQLLRRQRGLHD